MTEEQQEDAYQSLGVDEIIYLPDRLQELWSNIPAKQASIKNVLLPLQNWLTQESSSDDYVLVQGDFGAVYLMVEWSFVNDLNPVYSTTLRKTVEEKVDNEIKIKKTFKHQLFRDYEKLNN